MSLRRQTINFFNSKHVLVKKSIYLNYYNGTIITEWIDGSKLCEKILESESTIKTFVNSIVSISKYLKLDGWLINIENSIDEPKMLLQLVKNLSDAMHNAIPDSVVIWYDSVTESGKLNWQNCLNSENKVYFDACDGLFTNYCWDNSDLENTVEMAGNRKHDVYVGVDVWGRHFWGGGKFNTVEAIKEIHNYNLSMAIFAPAWTHEAIIKTDIIEASDSKCKNNCLKKEDEDVTKCELKEYFLLRENALWNTLWPYLNTRGPIQLPFHTYFCLGSGEKRRYGGEVIDQNNWFNLREQQYQKTFPVCYNSFVLNEVKTEPVKLVKKEDKLNETQKRSNNQDDLLTEKVCINICAESKRKPQIKTINIKPNGEDKCCVLHYSKDSYYGGSCLKIIPLKTDENDIELKVITRLFMCEFQCDYNFLMYFIIKPLSDCDTNQDLDMHLTVKNNKSKAVTKLILSEKYDDFTKSEVYYPINNTKEFEGLVKNVKSIYPGFYVDIKNDSNWKVRYYSVKCPNSTILQIDCELINDKCPVLLGGFGIVNDILSF